VTVVASVVTVGLTIAGGIEAFDEAAQARLASTLRASLGCFEPVCFLELRVAAGSVQIDALLTIPNTGEGSGTAVTDIAAAATTLAATSSSALSRTLGVTVTGTAAPTVQQAVPVPIVVAPPPPSSPSLLPSLPSPLLALSPPLAPPSSGVDSTMIVLVAGGTAGGTLLFMLFVLMCRRCRRNSTECMSLTAPRLHKEWSPRDSSSQAQAGSPAPPTTSARPARTKQVDPMVGADGRKNLVSHHV